MTQSKSKAAVTGTTSVNSGATKKRKLHKVRIAAQGTVTESAQIVHLQICRDSSVSITYKLRHNNGADTISQDIDIRKTAEDKAWSLETGEMSICRAASPAEAAAKLAERLRRLATVIESTDFNRLDLRD